MHTCKLVMKLLTSSNVRNVSILFLTHCCEVVYLAPLSYDFSYWCFVSATLFWVFCHFNFVKSLLALPLQLSCYYIYLSVGYVIRDPFKVIVCNSRHKLEFLTLCCQQMQESESVSQRKSLGRHRDEYTLDDSEKRAVKRPKLMGTNQLHMESSKIPNRSEVGLVNECWTIKITYVDLLSE